MRLCVQWRQLHVCQGSFIEPREVYSLNVMSLKVIKGTTVTPSERRTYESHFKSSIRSSISVRY